MHADEICVAQRVLEFDIFDPGFIAGYSARVAEVHSFLSGFDVFVILVGHVIAQNVHIESGALFNQRQTNAPGADDRDGLSGNFVAEKRQVWMPISPLVFAGEMLSWPHLSRQHTQHEKREFGGSLSEHISGMGEGDFVTVGVGAIDVVETHRDLRDYFQTSLPRLEYFSVNRITQSRD